jgi:hypothetical protein
MEMVRFIGFNLMVGSLLILGGAPIIYALIILLVISFIGALL